MKYRVYRAHLAEDGRLVFGDKPVAECNNLAAALAVSENPRLHGPDGAAIVRPDGRMIYSADEYRTAYAEAAEAEEADADAWRPAYKVVFISEDDGALVSSDAPSSGVVEYRPGAIAQPRPGCGPLFVFGSRRAATEYARSHWSGRARVYAAAAVGMRRPSERAGWTAAGLWIAAYQCHPRAKVADAVMLLGPA